MSVFGCGSGYSRWLARREAEMDAWEASLSPEERDAFQAEVAADEAWFARKYGKWWQFWK